MDNPLGKKSTSEVEKSLHRLRQQENSFAFEFFFLFLEMWWADERIRVAFCIGAGDLGIFSFGNCGKCFAFVFCIDTNGSEEVIAFCIDVSGSGRCSISVIAVNVLAFVFCIDANGSLFGDYGKCFRLSLHWWRYRFRFRRNFLGCAMDEMRSGVK